MTHLHVTIELRHTCYMDTMSSPMAAFFINRFANSKVVFLKRKKNTMQKANVNTIMDFQYIV